MQQSYGLSKQMDIFSYETKQVNHPNINWYSNPWKNKQGGIYEPETETTVIFFPFSVLVIAPTDFFPFSAIISCGVWHIVNHDSSRL